MAIECERLLTVKEVAERLHVHPITVRRLIASGRLPAVRIGRAVRVREAAVAKMTAEGRRVAGKLPYQWPPTEKEMERLGRIIDEMRARRARMRPLGITTTELIRQGRDELDQRADRHIGLDR